MSSRFSIRFKKRAVEKALNNSSGLTIKEVAASYGVGYSTLQRWIGDSRVPAFNQRDKTYKMASEKRPEDWSLADRLGIIIAGDGLDETALSALCRKSGLYPHHLEQWKADFLAGDVSGGGKTRSSENSRLRKENKTLKKELNRKDKALAETAALLVLKKKVAAFWDEEGEDN